MDTKERKKHWENIFATKDTTKVSWYEPVPETSIELINELPLTKNAKIIEVGSGDSFLADALLEKGFSNIFLLDISLFALNQIKKRLAGSLKDSNFFEQDILHFQTDKLFDLWHDRAVFHFIRSEAEKQQYHTLASKHIKKGGYLIVQTFSENGPEECSGLQIEKYSEHKLIELFSAYFSPVKCFSRDHTTPSGSRQNFQICLFQKK